MDLKQEDIDRLKRCVARTVATTPSGEVFGTAFLIGPKHALTCAHNLGPVEDQAATVKLTFAACPSQPERIGTPVAATLDWDWDMVVLELDEAIDVEPVQMSSTVLPGKSWDGFGYPWQVYNIGGLLLGGVVRDTNSRYLVRDEQRRRLHLSSVQARDMLKGASGSPVMVDGVIVGMVQNQVMGRPPSEDGSETALVTQLETLFALPLEEVQSTLKPWATFQRTRVKSEVGLGQRLSPHAGEIQRFVDEYLGTPEKPVPFGGREKELESLDRWLMDAAAAPYALITAEAGRGKSALLVQWAHSLRASNRVRVIFIPVSIRFETALSSVTLSVLAAGLAEAFGETETLKASLPDDLKSASLERMRRGSPNGIEVVVIIDGLDEATGWAPGPTLFPRLPGSGIRAVISARYLAGDVDGRGWLYRLGWEQPPGAEMISLAPLTRDGIHDVLASMGNPLAHLQTDIDLVEELFRLSQGDPLTVGLYVKALSKTGPAASRLRPEDLPSIEEGFEGFVRRSMNDQARRAEGPGRPALWRDQDVLDFLNLCAAAMGPLLRHDVAKIAGRSLASRLDGVKQEVDRFVYGDGQSKGFVFSHPRFAHHFYKQMGEGELAEWDERILKYGRGTLKGLNAGTLDPIAASRYVIQHYRAHLERSKAASPDLYALATIGWLRGWQSVEVAHTGFLADIESVAHRAESSGLPLAPQVLSTLVCCALCRSSVAALNISMPPDLLAVCVREGVLSSLQALTIARQAPDGGPIAEALSRLAATPRFDLNDEAFASAIKISDPQVRARAVVAVGKRVGPELKPRAIAIATEDLKSASVKALALAELASSLETGSQVDVERQALATALAIKDRRSRMDTLIELVSRLHGDERSTAIRKALEAARKLPERDLSESPICDAFARLAKNLPDALKKKALGVAMKIEDPEACARTLACLAPHLEEIAQLHAMGKALSIANNLKDSVAKARCIADLLPCPCLEGEQKTQVVSQAWKAAQSIDDVEWRPMMLARLASHLPPALYNDAIDAAKKEGGWGQATILIALAHKLLGQQLQRAVDSAWDIEDESQRAGALARLSPNLPESRKREAMERALDAAHAVGHGRQTQAFVAIAPYLSSDVAIKARKLTGAEGSMPAIEALIGLATHLPDGLRADAARDALSAVRAIHDNVESVRVLIDIAPYLSPTDQLLADIEEAASTTGTSADCARALVLLAAGMSNAEKHAPARLLTKALAMMEHLPGWNGFSSPRAEMLGKLSRHADDSTRSAALEIARLLKPEAAKAQGLTAVARALREPSRSTVTGDALTTSRAIANPQHKAFALARLVQELPEGERPTVAAEALEAAHKSTYPLTIASVVSTMAPRLDDVMLKQLLTTTLPAFDGEVLTDVLTSLAPLLEAKPDLMRQAHALVNAIKDDDFERAARAALAPYRQERDSMKKALNDLLNRPGNEWTRAMALARLAKHLPAMEKGEALQRAMAMMKAIGTNELRRQVADALLQEIPEWVSQNRSSAYDAWKGTLRELSTLSRPMFLPYLRMLLALGLALTDASQRESAAAECARVVKDVTRWPWGRSPSPGA